MPPFSVCVFCGSRNGQSPEFLQAAQGLGQGLAERNWRLVYGAGDVGLMGAVARAAAEAGGNTFGVIPDHLMQREVGKSDLTSFIVTENMHERKKVMFMNCDSIVLLPGGAGSLDEFFEVLTWRQLGKHAKPIVVINTDGYWDKLVALIEHIVEQDFASASLLEFFTVVGDVPAAFAVLEQHAPETRG